jgi:membrane protein implicated in regulation of membrane protease activity
MLAFLATLFTAANAPYTTALLVVALYVGLQIFGLLSWGEHGADGDHALPSHDAGGGADAHADADVGADAHLDGDAGGGDAHADADHDIAHDADHDAAHDSEHGDHESDSSAPGVLSSLLGVLGVGRVPLAIVWQTFFTMFGLTGVTATTLAASLLGPPRPYFLAFSIPIALVLGSVLSASTVRGVARLIPSSSGDATRKRDLVGCTGVVISSRVDPEFGEVRLHDPLGRTLRLICHTLPGEPGLPEGTEVVVVDYERTQGHLFVSRLVALPEGRK